MGDMNVCPKNGAQEYQQDARLRTLLRPLAFLRIEPKTTLFKGASPVDFLVSVNLKRRHLDITDRVVTGVKLRPLYAAEAAKREKAGVKATLPSRDGRVIETEGRTASHVAKAVGVSEKTMERGFYIEDNAPEEWTNAEHVTINEKYKAAQAVEKEKSKDHDASTLSREDRAAREEASAGSPA